MSGGNLDKIDATIEDYATVGKARRSKAYRWPSSEDKPSGQVEPLMSLSKGYKWHNVVIEDIPKLVGLVSSHPEIEGRCMVFDVTPVRDKQKSNQVDVAFVRYEHLIPSLSVMSGRKLAEEVKDRLGHDDLSLYCTASGYFWLRKGIYGLW